MPVSPGQNNIINIYSNFDKIILLEELNSGSGGWGCVLKRLVRNGAGGRDGPEDKMKMVDVLLFI